MFQKLTTAITSEIANKSMYFNKDYTVCTYFNDFFDDKNNYALMKNLEIIEKYKEKIYIPHTPVVAF